MVFLGINLRWLGGWLGDWLGDWLGGWLGGWYICTPLSTTTTEKRHL